MPKKMSLGMQLANLKKSYAKMEEAIPKWIKSEGLTSMIIPQEEYLQEYSMWSKIEFGVILTLRVPFATQGFKQRICIYPGRIEMQYLYQLRPLSEFFGSDGRNDHNIMLHADKMIKYQPGAIRGQREFFKNEATFKDALKRMIFSGHMGHENERHLS